MCICAQVLSCVQLFVSPWTVTLQAPLSMEFSRQVYWSGLPFSTPGHLSHPVMECVSLACVSCICMQILYCWATRKGLNGKYFQNNILLNLKYLRISMCTHVLLLFHNIPTSFSLLMHNILPHFLVLFSIFSSITFILAQTHKKHITLSHRDHAHPESLTQSELY